MSKRRTMGGIRMKNPKGVGMNPYATGGAGQHFDIYPSRNGIYK